MSSHTPSIASLRRAIELTEQIDKLEAELKVVLSGGATAASAAPVRTRKPAPSKPGKKKRNMSPEARARIVAAQKLRWAKVRAQIAASAR